MIVLLVAFSLIIIACLFLNKLSGKIGVPALLLFHLLGMGVRLAGTGMGENIYWVVRDICTVALIFIMFYGGFGTRWSSAKPVARDSALLATVGVFLTAALTGLFCHYALRWDWTESFLMGAVISSIDAASVFSILKGKKLGLKYNTAPLIELESGSNDAMAYMLTAVMMSVLSGTATVGNVIWFVFAQLVFGVAGGLLIGVGAMYVLRRLRFSSSGNLTLFILAVVVVSYALPSWVGGNGYLSAYITGIILGNNDFPDRKPMINFFDGITGLMQISIPWHRDRIERLGYTEADMWDIEPNIAVAADYLAELFAELNDDYYVLMRYNGDSSAEAFLNGTGEPSSYATEICTRAAVMTNYHEKGGAAWDNTN